MGHAHEDARATANRRVCGSGTRVAPCAFVTSRTQPQLAFTLVAPTHAEDDDDFADDTTLLLVRRPARHLLPRWNPPLPRTGYERLFK
jgi:hypothetical protein